MTSGRADAPRSDREPASPDATVVASNDASEPPDARPSRGWQATILLLALTAVIMVVSHQSAALRDEQARSDRPFQSPHAHALALVAGSELHPSHAIAPAHAPAEVSARSARANRPIVMGMLPYWTSGGAIRWDLLTHLACFAITVQADGALGDRHGWPWRARIAEGAKHGVRILPVIVCFDPHALNALAEDGPHRDRFIEEVIALLHEGGDGVVIDFEGNGAWVERLPILVADLAAAVRRDHPKALIFVATPAERWKGWDFVELARRADGLFVMAYDYNGRWSKHPGPSAPLAGPGLDIGQSISHAYEGVPREQLILGLPWYGNEWHAISDDPSDPGAKWVRIVTADQAHERYTAHGRRWDPVTLTPWTTWAGGGGVRQLWCDDEESLAAKCAFARERRLGGIGIWALGFEGQLQGVWDAIESAWIAEHAAAAAP